MVVVARAPVQLLKIRDIMEKQLFELEKINTHLSLMDDEVIKEEDVEKE